MAGKATPQRMTRGSQGATFTLKQSGIMSSQTEPSLRPLVAFQVPNMRSPFQIPARDENPHVEEAQAWVIRSTRVPVRKKPRKPEKCVKNRTKGRKSCAKASPLITSPFSSTWAPFSRLTVNRSMTAVPGSRKYFSQVFGQKDPPETSPMAGSSAQGWRKPPDLPGSAITVPTTRLLR